MSVMENASYEQDSRRNIDKRNTTNSELDCPEMGYLFLHDCFVKVQMDDDTQHDQLSIPEGTWVSVSLFNNHTSEADGGERTKRSVVDTSTTAKREIERQEEGCPICDLILHHSANTSTISEGECPNESRRKSNERSFTSSLLCLDVSDAGRFDGTVYDIVHNDTSRHCCVSKRTKKRSDAALMLGLALTCQDEKKIMIKNLQILLKRQSKPDNSHFPLYIDCQVSLIITLTFPQLLVVPTAQNSGGRSILLTNSNKPLPPSTQLLLSLIRSDWDHLDKRMREEQFIARNKQGRKRKQRKKKDHQNRKSGQVSFFPQKLSLEELYVRIPTAASSSSIIVSCTPTGRSTPKESSYNTRSKNHHCPRSGIYNRKTKQQKQHGQQTNGNNDDDVGLLDMPQDILRSKLAPYFRALDLDSLRCSCKYMYTTLLFVIPGMKLRLYKHQIKSLSWMRMRETKQLSEYEILSHEHSCDHIKACTNGNSTSTFPLSDSVPLSTTKNVSINSLNSSTNFADGDGHRAMTGGKSVLLCNRNGGTGIDDNDSSINGAKIRLDQYIGKELYSEDDSEIGLGVLDRKVARGGLLCDDPGLGKTITVLSLILQTLGLSTTPNNDLSKIEKKKHPKQQQPAFDNNDPLKKEEIIFQSYWREQITPAFRRPELFKLINKLRRRCGHLIAYFEDPVDPVLDDCPDYFDIIKSPMCLSVIKRNISKDKYDVDFNAFVADVKLCFSNCILYNSCEHQLHQAACNFIEIFDSMINFFKECQLRSARKSFSSTAAKPNCAVAALIEEESHQNFIQTLVPSSSTLLVIPSVLMEHWQEQISMHVDLKYCTGKQPLVYEYNQQNHSRLDEIVFLCKVKKTHSPLIFIDKAGTKKLPSPEFLAMFSIVITTTQRFTNEWKNGSFQDEIKRGENGKFSNANYFYFERTEIEACPLLKVHWLRLVVDEGHSMGRGQGNSAIRFASWICAQRRWAVTGTPTRQTISQSGLNNLLCLMKFLQHDFFTPRLGGDKVWQRLISRSWIDGCLSSFFRLRSLMSLLMVRHTKLDIEELPMPRFRTTIVPMSSLEVTTYNTLVCAVQSNILITSMEAKTSGGQDSLLHRSQAAHARKALGNIRLSCSGGTRVIPTLSQRFRKEFIDECRMLQMSESRIKYLKEYLHHAETEQLSQCQCCGILLSTLLVLPCGDLLCTECMDSKTTVCLICDKEFDPDEFQLLQPGMDYQWKWNLEEEKAEINARAMDAPTNPPPVPQHDILPQAFDPNNMPIGARIIQPLSGQNNGQSRRRGERKKFGDGHQCEYDKHSGSGKCVHCLTEHDSCKLINELSRCEICHRRAEQCPKDEAKSSYVVDSLLRLYEAQNSSVQLGSAHTYSSQEVEEMNVKNRPLKVIVFSQFRKILNFVGDRLLRRFGTACVAEYWGSFRSRELHKFSHSDDCFCMLLGKDGSEGLDLSFVTHIFFLEAVWDQSLENQVVARAWRMGASGRVDVETLIAQSSVEEQMWKLEKMHAAGNHKAYDLSSTEIDDDVQSMFTVAECASSSEYVRAKIQFLLKNMQLIKHPSIIPLTRGNNYSNGTIASGEFSGGDDDKKRSASEILSSSSHPPPNTASENGRTSFHESQEPYVKKSKISRVTFST